ncbi:MAG: hypothetical protein IT233_11020 [Bacteroidia bacterium]|nr:hypothetical protein [Bacteroidia bacterium]
MSHFLILGVLTLGIGFLAWRIWKITREPGFLLGLGLMYYWTLLGAWFLIYDDLSGGKGIEFGLSYYIYTELLFPVHADTDYLYSILLYGSFMLIIEGVMLFFLSRRKHLMMGEGPAPVTIHHGWLILGCVLAALISFSLVWTEILTAAKFKHSIYVVTRQQQGKWFVIHQLLNQAAVSGIFLGLLTWLTGPAARFITGSTARKWLWLYIPAVVFITGYMLLLGNKKELMTGGILGLVFFYSNCGKKIEWLKSSVFCILLVIPFIFNNGLRAYSPVFLTRIFNTEHLTFALKKEIVYTKFTLSSSALSFLFSNEMFCAHMSMYGAVHHDVPYTWGSSIVSLSASMVPRMLWPNRPGPIYEHYAGHFHLPEGQGFTIHHATGWYLNFGIAGVVAGAVLLGWLWIRFYQGMFAAGGRRFRFMRIALMLAFAGLVSEIPAMIRSGPESYKVVIFEGMLLPALVIFLATLFIKKNNAR